MGAESSSLSELASNPHLKQLASSECLTPNDPFWNQLLSFTFHIPRTSADQRLLEESTVTICKNFAINNCQTGNFGSLVRVFLTRATELKSSNELEDNIFTWQTYNALFIIRNICKYFVENLSDEMLLQQFEMTSPKAEAEPKEDIMDLLLCCLNEILVDVPVLGYTYALHLECVNLLLVLLSIQMFQPSPAGQSSFFKHIMQGKCSIHACVLMKTLIQNFVKQEMAPRELVTANGAGLFSVMTLGIGPRLISSGEVEVLDVPLLATQSLLLTLVLANHCTSESGLHNPYRQALFAFTNSQGNYVHAGRPKHECVHSAEDSDSNQAIATFKTDYTAFYDVLCNTLKEDQTTLLLYLLMHRNSSIKAFVMSRTNVDQLVVPLLKILYHAQEKNSHHIYMALIILLILSEDDSFNRAVHEINLKNVAWFKERSVGEISLGGLLILVVIRTIQYNMTRMRDKYLHTNCLAALANMSAQFRDLHPYVAQRLVSLFGQLQKKHSRLVEQIKDTSSAELPDQSADHSDTETDIDYASSRLIADLAVLEEVIRMVLEIVNSTLTYSLQHNANLVYAMLYHKELFGHFRTHPTFQDIIQNIDTVLSFFSARLEQADKNLSVPEVAEVIKQGALQFRKDRLKKFPELKFKYVEEEAPEEFFIPYVWSLVYHASQLYFNPSRIRIFSLHSSSSAAS
ncbi:hypothetical protein CAPTEDRAFT_6632 [Capitella teleta]|uniref:Dymeclin n=1 Tax=Capitella teleta TaxID=283909 RepID=R7ULE1_CAPTE|nr:hypothetical protein CAPTEDRAFT_6632 [Capitella teleta]|eukprot:ELU06913.1 hypothetical protein CAPTEDRAFT_6632 [Capitella teleta]